MRHTIEIKNGITRHPLYRMNQPVDLLIDEGEQIAIVGPNGSGKSRLTDIIVGRLPLLMNEVKYDFGSSPYKLVSDHVKFMSFRDSYGDNDSTYYYQQRWNQHDVDDSMPTVQELLEQAFQASLKSAGFGMNEDEVRRANEQKIQLKEKLYTLFHLDTLLDKKIIFLSSGELRKFQLTRTLFADPRVLILDNPFIGLDSTTREQLKELLKLLIRDIGLQIILVLSRTDDIPDFITHVVPVEDLTVFPKISRSNYRAEWKDRNVENLSEKLQTIIGNLPDCSGEEKQKDGDPVLVFNQVSIRYGQRAILKDLNWTVKKGEKWALEGENGSGKSTLIKCILGLYKPTDGRVRLFGTDASKIPEEDIGKRVGVTFQDFNKYIFSLRENVGFGDLSKIHNDVEIKEAIRKAGAQDVLEQCHGDLSTVLDRALDSDGTALSGGQWQKLALARTYLSDKDIMIFDEPGAALDPISELEQFEEIRSKMKGKTSILVSHRIGFARMADRIIVLKNGKIVESGCHDFLMEQNGEYAHLYNEQKQWYEKAGGEVT